LLLTEP